MDIETSNAIKLFFPNPSLVQVIYEAVANSLDAEASQIGVNVTANAPDAAEALRITVTDNGTGFNESSFDRFRRLLKPQDSFHKGVGRLVYLNYFGRVSVESIWDNRKRTFTFTESFQGENEVTPLDHPQPNATKLEFSQFHRNRVRSYNELSPAVLKERITEQFLPTLHDRRRQHRDFKITISLCADQRKVQKDFLSSEETITCSDLPELTSVFIKDPLLDAFDGVEMLYRVKSGVGERSMLTAVSIDGRTIPIRLVAPNSLPTDNSGIFLFFSRLFMGAADSSRQKLVLPDTISESVLLQVLRREVGKVLSEHIPQIGKKNDETRRNFEFQFPHLLGLFEDTTAGLIDKDEALEIAQKKFFAAQKEILQCESLDDKAYEKSLELSSRTLTEYVLYREKIIAKMREMDESNSEADIHNLICPRWNHFEQQMIVDCVYRNNAWLLDDKFMSFQTILSEQRMDKLIDVVTLDEDVTVDDGRPDIAMIFSGDPDDVKAVDVVVVEVKKKTDEEKENQYAINQLLSRATKLAEHCPNIQRIWYYAIIQISSTMATRLRQQKWAPLFSKGQVYYQEFPTERPDGSIVPTPTFVMSFDAIVADAGCRNHTFLQILRSGMKRRYSSEATVNDDGKQVSRNSRPVEVASSSNKVKLPPQTK